MEEQKEVCKCEQLTVVKKGFNGFKAVSTFIGIAVFSAFIIGIIIINQNYDTQLDASISNKYGLDPTPHPNYLLINSILMIIANIVAFLGLFAGTIDMNNLLSVCPKCGEVKELSKERKRNKYFGFIVSFFNSFVNMGALIYILDDRIIGNDKSDPPKMTLSMLNHNMSNLKEGEEWYLGITHERIVDTSIQTKTSNQPIE